MKSKAPAQRPFSASLRGPRFLLACLSLGLCFTFLGDVASLAAKEGQSLSYYMQLKRDIKSAVYAADKDALCKLLNSVKQKLQQESGPPAYLTYYYAAYIDDRIVYLTRLKKDGENTHKYLDEGITYLENVIRLKRNFTEGYILLASLYGQKAADEMVASFFGPKSTYMVTKAINLEPDNPRAHLIEGIGKYYAPRAFGGDRHKAVQALEEAIRCFQKYRSPNAAYPDWGYPDTYAWLAQIHAATRDYDRAREVLLEGLAIDPKNIWLKTLLAQLDDQVKGSKKVN